MYFIDELLNTVEALNKLEKDLSQKYNRFSNFRLLLFLAGMCVVILTWSSDRLLSFGLFILFVACFVYLVIKHSNLEALLTKTRCELEVYTEYLDRSDKRWEQFSDTGADFSDPSHPYSGDLDLFGKHSLFQWMNIARSYLGRVSLKNMLSHPYLDMAIMLEKQKAVQELASKFDFVIGLQIQARLAPDLAKDPHPFLKSIESPDTFTQQKGLRRIAFAMPLLSVSSLLLFFFDILAFWLPLTFFIANLLLALHYTAQTAPRLTHIHQYKKNIQSFEKMLRLVEKQSFSSQLLNALQNPLIQQKHTASHGLKAFDTIASMIDMRHNALMFLLLNGCFLWDIHCIYAVERWKQSYGMELRKWLNTLGDLEAYGSFALLPKLHPQWCFPTFLLTDQSFIGKELGHPLIHASKRVHNDVSLENNILVITGSNLSGKTTLMRTLGINAILAYCGAPVCAKSLSLSLMTIFSSMRIKDDLSAGLSTFYSELLRIKMIIDFSKTEKPLFFFIDEIFRGTNSTDRILGAQSVVKSLNRPWISGLITTHDVELCALEKELPEKIKNFHFEEQYVAGEILFDYHLRPGHSTTTNAKYLMQMIGIDIHAP